MTLRALRAVSLCLTVIFLVSTAGLAQEAEPEEPVTEDSPSRVVSGAPVVIRIPSDGLGYSENGELLLITSLTNTGTQVSSPIDLIAIVLNDCIIDNLPQTCRFAALGSFQSVTPNGIEPGSTVQWVFNFGRQPRVDLNRWSIIWYELPRASAAGLNP